jgi:hypothetical protein
MNDAAEICPYCDEPIGPEDCVRMTVGSVGHQLRRALDDDRR